MKDAPLTPISFLVYFKMHSFKMRENSENEEVGNYSQLHWTGAEVRIGNNRTREVKDTFCLQMPHEDDAVLLWKYDASVLYLYTSVFIREREKRLGGMPRKQTGARVKTVSVLQIAAYFLYRWCST